MFLKARSYHLGRWFVTHFTHPYPSKDQKDQLAARTNMTRNQVCAARDGEVTRTQLWRFGSNILGSIRSGKEDRDNEGQ